MPVTALVPSGLDSLKDLTRLVQTAEGFQSVITALTKGHSATIDGAWGSSAGVAAAALGVHAPRTLLIAIAHPRDLDGWGDDIAGFAGLRPTIFPAWDHLPDDRTIVDEVAGQRLRLLKQLDAAEPPRYVLTTIQALLQPVPDRAQLIQNRRVLQAGERVEMDELAGWLVEHGYRRTDAVELPGEFSRRGGILDVFSPDADAPYRLEFFGDEVESIRLFSPQTQRSLGSLAAVEVMGVQAPGLQPVDLTGHLCDYLPADAWVVLVEPEELHEQAKQYLERVADPGRLFSPPAVFQRLLRFPSITIAALPSPSVEAACHLRVESVERFSGDVTRLRDELDNIAAGDRVLIACHNEAECQRLHEVLGEGQLARSGRLRLVLGRVRAGFRLVPSSPLSSLEGASPLSPLEGASPLSPLEGRGVGGEGWMQPPRPPHPLPLAPEAGGRGVESIVVLSDHELFHREEVRHVLPRRRIESRAIDSFLDLSENDLVVHVSHGIARYRGMKLMEKDGRREEHLVLEFRDGVRLYVPASKIDLVQKYVGGSRVEPELSKLGGTSWQRKKAKVQEAVLDLASEMIQLQALREAQPGIAYPPDSEWQAEFEAAFPYEETPDQLTTLAEIKRDMERARPMDRLICGDVGYGKTELAIRAAFKAIDNGRQVAVLVPTTVLAEQHYRTFSQRLAEYPFVVESISRFRTAAEQKRILERLARGGVDVIIGTHRLLSADVQFKDLGLVIIDEEQRFGVEHKERLKRLRETVDVLTMTATPIPRTLHLALLGIRDISNLETPPPDRLAIETRIARFDPQLIRHAILRELNRDGQVYFVHNRVYNIQAIADQVQAIVPEARVSVAHGQMPEHELEQAMLRFVQRQSDILVATTIIESGLDIPNANTIFINEADNYGLADLHQLRGRVGRYKHRAYAYLLLDPSRTVSPTAARRLKAIEEFTELGAGFKIALRDLEIRGAGNILGPQQSGHIAAVGYEMYCQLLENAVRQLKNQPLRTPLDVTLDLPWPAFLSRDYVPGQRLRIEVYRRLARIRRLERLEDFRQELRDRFGLWPEPVEWLLRLAELRLLAARWQVATLHLDKPADPSFGPTDVVLGYRSVRQIQRLAARSDGRLRVVNDHQAYFRLLPPELDPPAMYAALKNLLRLPDRTV
ncbi:MAG TPA: transcription-repair coupling factor [Gemmataceae bacterium]|nr:transcription-repair coupling factor [Gemmataceae bacterium]